MVLIWSWPSFGVEISITFVIIAFIWGGYQFWNIQWGNDYFIHGCNNRLQNSNFKTVLKRHARFCLLRLKPIMLNHHYSLICYWMPTCWSWIIVENSIENRLIIKSSGMTELLLCFYYHWSIIPLRLHVSSVLGIPGILSVVTNNYPSSENLNQ